MDHGMDLSACFSADYSEARGRFTAAVDAAGGTIETYRNPNRGPAGEALATDVAWIGPRDARLVLATVSATHGVEGFCGSGAQVDWLTAGGPARLADGMAALMIHAINPHGFAWLRRVTEEGVDLNRNHVDFDRPVPENPGYAELADAFVPREISGPVFDAAEARLAAWRQEHGEHAFQVARGGGQYTHREGMFYGGSGPTWSRRTLEAVFDDFDLAGRDGVAVIDYHTGLGPFGYGEPISGHEPGSVGLERSVRWFGDSVTVPSLGTSSSVPKVGLSEQNWQRVLGDKLTYVALEYGTYDMEAGRRALREDNWLHEYGKHDWDHSETRRIKAQIRKQYYPDTDDWKEQVLFRSRQLLRQARLGLVADDAKPR